MGSTMVRVVYCQRDGTENQVEIEAGDSLMNGAVFAGIDGIDGICGGTASCGTCHVHVDADWQERCGEPGAAEQARLSRLRGRLSNSRLACQIFASPELDGLRVIVAREPRKS